MGVCLSCLRGRGKEHRESLADENQPLLAQGQSADYGSDDMNDEQWLQRQQELDGIVHRANDYFIDVSVIKNTELTEPLRVEGSSLPQELAQKMHEVRLVVPKIHPINEADKQQLLHDIGEIEQQ